MTSAGLQAVQQAIVVLRQFPPTQALAAAFSDAGEMLMIIGGGLACVVKYRSHRSMLLQGIVEWILWFSVQR